MPEVIGKDGQGEDGYEKKMGGGATVGMEDASCPSAILFK